MQRYMTLRKTGDSLAITIPVEVVLAYCLSAGDSILWDIGQDEAKVKFFRVTKTMAPAERVEEVVVEGT
jgi:antitoxin component of MazEF toxin-antitoxin module